MKCHESVQHAGGWVMKSAMPNMRTKKIKAVCVNVCNANKTRITNTMVLQAAAIWSKSWSGFAWACVKLVQTWKSSQDQAWSKPTYLYQVGTNSNYACAVLQQHANTSKTLKLLQFWFEQILAEEVIKWVTWLKLTKKYYTHFSSWKAWLLTSLNRCKNGWLNWYSCTWACSVTQVKANEPHKPGTQKKRCEAVQHIGGWVMQSAIPNYENQQNQGCTLMSATENKTAIVNATFASRN